MISEKKTGKVQQVAASDPTYGLFLILDKLTEIVGDLNTAKVFLYVALHDGQAQAPILDAMGFHQSTGRWYLYKLANEPYKYNGRLEEPLGLLEVRMDPNDRKEKHYHLTKSGKKLLDDLSFILKLGAR